MGLTAMLRRTFLAGGASSLAASSLAKPAIAVSASSRVLKFIPQADLAGLDPHVSTAYVTRNHGYMVFDTLFGENGLHQISPQMAAGHLINDNGRTCTIILREHLVFHDGEPVLARDCVASIKRWAMRDPFGEALMDATDSIKAPDDRTIVFRLKRPFPLLTYALGKSTTYMPAIMPERLAMTDPFTEVKEVIGSGPFRFNAAERELGRLSTYSKFQEYTPRGDGIPNWTAGQKIALFDRVEWHTIGESDAAAEALTRGDMDWWDYVTPDQVHPLRRNQNVDVTLQDPSGQIGVMRLNHLNPPFDNPGIRRVLLAAIDQREFMRAVTGGESTAWQSGVGVFCPGTTMENSGGLDLLNGKHDQNAYNKLKKDLLNAGYVGDPVVVLLASNLPAYKELGLVGIETLRRCGFNVDIQSMDWSDVLERRNSRAPIDKGGWCVFFTGIAGTEMLNPPGHLNLRADGDAAWVGWPNSPKIEALRTKWLEQPNTPSQFSVAIEIQKQAMIDVPFIPLGLYLQMTAYRRNLAGVLNGFALFWNVHRIT